MATDGPKQDNIALYQQILDTKDTAKKQQMMKALSTEQKREFVLHLQYTKSAMKVRRLESEVQSLGAREAALMSQDKALLNQASASYASSVGSVPMQQSAQSVSTSTQKFTK